MVSPGTGSLGVADHQIRVRTADDNDARAHRDRPIMNPGWNQAKHEYRPVIHDPTPRSAGSAVNRERSNLTILLP